VVDHAHVAARPARRRTDGLRSALGGGFAGDEAVVTAQLAFRDVTIAIRPCII
jgi:hypothetical protein